MTLILIERYTDDRNRLIYRYHAPSSTTPGKVYRVDNLVDTDVWTCECKASTFKKPCRHIPNWQEPPQRLRPERADRSVQASVGSEPAPGEFTSIDAITYSGVYPGQFDESTAARCLNLREMIEDYATRNATFRKYVVERKSGCMGVALLAEFYGLRIRVPDGESLTSYLGGMPKFSTIRTESLIILKRHQEAEEPDWMDEDPNEREERHQAYRRFYGAEAQGQQRFQIEATS